MHASLTEHPTPYHEGFGDTVFVPTEALEGLNNIVAHQATVIAVIGRFKILMIEMLIVISLVLFLRKPR